jgi:hypothetical protein
MEVTAQNTEDLRNISRAHTPDRMVSRLSESGSVMEHYKFRLPISIKKTNSHLTLTSGSVSCKIAIDELDCLNFRGIDAEQFLSFDIRTQPRQIGEASKNGYRLFHSEKASSGGQGAKPNTYEYYKKDDDSSYAFVVSSKRGVSPKHRLGSLHDPGSMISRVLDLCPEKNWFSRSDFPDDLIRNSAQVLKASLDILTKEGILQRRQKAGYTRRVFEYFRVPSKAGSSTGGLAPFVVEETHIPTTAT